jgi:hypothetical protein
MKRKCKRYSLIKLVFLCLIHHVLRLNPILSLKYGIISIQRIVTYRELPSTEYYMRWIKNIWEIINQEDIPKGRSTVSGFIMCSQPEQQSRYLHKHALKLELPLYDQKDESSKIHKSLAVATLRINHIENITRLYFYFL